MKTLLSILFLAFSASALAETCTFVMKDYYQNDVQRFTRFSYSYDAACSEAHYDCKEDLAEREVRGQYGLTCREEYYRRYPTPVPPSYPTPYPGPSYPTPYPGPSYPTPYPGPSYPTPYPGPSYPAPRPLPPREPHWPSEPPRDPRFPRDPRGPHYPRR